MNCVIPFTKEIKFNTNIAEVLSISLEHDYTVNDEELLGKLVLIVKNLNLCYLFRLI